MQSFYEKRKETVRVCGEEDEWFEVGVGLTQGCVISPWLLNLFIKAAMKKVREKSGDVGVTLIGERRKIE